MPEEANLQIQQLLPELLALGHLLEHLLILAIVLPHRLNLRLMHQKQLLGHLFCKHQQRIASQYSTTQQLTII